MNQIGITSCGVDEERKRSSDLSLSEEEPPNQKKRSSDLSLHKKKKRSFNFSLSEEQLHKIYDVKPITVESKEGYYTGIGTHDEEFVRTGKPLNCFTVVCKVCKRSISMRTYCPSFREDSVDSPVLQGHAGEHIEAGFIDCDGTRLRNEIPVTKGYRRACEYCGCGYKRCGSGAYVEVVQLCFLCNQLGQHSSEDCPSKGDGDVSWRPSSPCCSPRKIDD